MKRFALLLALVMGGWQFAPAAEAPGLTFYLQFVCATDADSPPMPGAKLVGPELGRRFGVFRWKYYWEVKHDAVTLKTGEKARRRMNPHREVEVVLDSPKEMTVSLYLDGKISRKRRQSVDTKFYIAGGDREDTQSWFIVVRRDKPNDLENKASQLGYVPAF